MHFETKDEVQRRYRMQEDIVFLLPDEEVDNAVAFDEPVGKIWKKGRSICVMLPLGYNVIVEPNGRECQAVMPSKMNPEFVIEKSES
jgi:NOL1/NOP2/fmu family ribosome biogenesis protein